MVVIKLINDLEVSLNCCLFECILIGMKFMVYGKVVVKWV